MDRITRVNNHIKIYCPKDPYSFWLYPLSNVSYITTRSNQLYQPDKPLEYICIFIYFKKAILNESSNNSYLGWDYYREHCVEPEGLPFIEEIFSLGLT